MEIKEIVPLKNIVQDLWTGRNSVIDPLIPAVIEAWIRVVPESLRPGIYLEGIREGTLYLLVSNPVVGQQFQFLKDSIRVKINEILGEPIVKGIRVKPGSAPEGLTHPKENKDKASVKLRSLSKKERIRIQHLCAEIKNPELRDQVRAAMEKSFCRE